MSAIVIALSDRERGRARDTWHVHVHDAGERSAPEHERASAVELVVVAPSDRGRGRGRDTWHVHVHDAGERSAPEPERVSAIELVAIALVVIALPDRFEAQHERAFATELVAISVERSAPEHERASAIELVMIAPSDRGRARDTWHVHVHDAGERSALAALIRSPPNRA